ncbi:MAG TPA: extensin family protein [Bradyrhizobium sp.]|nr:extensin family protein [Bradyrhizobium sp.]
MAMVSAAAALLMLCAPFEPAAARRIELFPWGDLFGIHRPKHRRVKHQARSVPLPKPRPAEAPAASPRGTAENAPKKGGAGKPPSVPAQQPAKPAPPESAKTNQPKPAPSAEPPEQPKETTEQATPAPAPQPSACRQALTDEIAVAPSIPAIHGPGDCGGEDLVRLEAVVLPDQRRVTLKPAAILRCKMASEIANWVRTDIAPLASSLGSEISTLDNLDSYECRGRNGIPGAKLSEHGHANALDVHGFGLANGRSIVLTDPAVPRELRENMLHSACTRFTTVLGPGSDGYHEQHIHLDLMERHNDYRICEWNVYDPMPQIAPLLPAERPTGAPPRQAEASPEAVTPGGARPNGAKHGPASSGQTAPDQGSQNQAKPDRAKLDRAKPDQARPDQAKPGQTRGGPGKSGEAASAREPPADRRPTKKRRINRRF